MNSFKGLYNTKLKRRIVYVKMLEYFEQEYQKLHFGFCYALQLTTLWSESPSQFVELKKFKLKKKYWSGFYWFPVENTDKRMQILQTIIAQIDADPKEWHEKVKIGSTNT